MAVASVHLPALFGTDLFNVQVPDWVAEALKGSPSLAIGALVFYLAFKHIAKSHQAHIASLTAEKDRLVKERDKLQDLVLKNRLSTVEPPAAPKQGPKNKGGQKK